MFYINRWVSILQTNTQGANKRAICSLIHRGERGLLEMRDSIQALGLVSSCILVYDFPFIIKNEFLYVDVGSMVESNHVKYCMSFIFHTCGLVVIKLLCI